MASSANAHRAVAIGVSGGLGIALPAAAWAATLPFPDINDIVRADAVPFAAGALVGVGALAACTGILAHRAERPESAEAAEEASFASVFGDAGEASPRAQRFKRSTPKGVPVIARAVDAPSMEDAWAEIDAMLDDDSPISCDPARSKDMYQIAFEEMRRTASAPHATAEAAAGTAPAASAPADSTAVFLAAARPAVAVPQPEPVPAMPTAPEVPVADYRGHEAMWAAALSILDEDAAPVTAAPSAAVPVPAAPAHAAAAPVAAAAPGIPTTPAPVPGPVRADLTGTATAERLAAVAEGEREVAVHSRVNEILEEEFRRVASKSVRRTSREFLRVIQGGTMSMPRLQAEA